MRFIDLKKYISVRNSVTLRISIVYSVFVPFLLFLLTLSSGLKDAFLIFLISFVLLFGLIFVLKSLVNRGIEKKRRRTNFECLYLDVYKEGQTGGLCILDKKIVFHTLSPGGTLSDFEYPLNRDVYIGVGAILQSTFSKIKYGKVELGYIVIKDDSNNYSEYFSFYNIDDVITKISHRISEVSQFEGENHGRIKEEN
jgi:hypothetical protein